MHNTTLQNFLIRQTQNDVEVGPKEGSEEVSESRRKFEWPTQKVIKPVIQHLCLLPTPQVSQLQKKYG